MEIPQFFRLRNHVRAVASDIFRYIGPGLLVTVGFIDPGNWAANVAAGADYGYTLLWMVTLGTIMLILLQHNAAHLGIVTGYCVAEAATIYLPPAVSRTLLGSAWLAAVATALAELLGAAIALKMLTGLPIGIGAILSLILVFWLLLSRSYNRIENLIIGFVSLIGAAFVFELILVGVQWNRCLPAWVNPSIPPGSLPIVMGVLGAVVMPHNLFLHSEIIQSRQWNLQGEEVVRNRLKFELFDTLFSMLVGWAINSAMIIMAAATFYQARVPVTDLAQAEKMLGPLLGSSSAIIFAVALLLAGIASSITAGMAGGSIIAGMYGEPYNSQDSHTRRGVGATLAAGALLIWTVPDPFKGLIFSQILLSVQLPWTILLLIYLTSARRVMGKHANGWTTKIMLISTGVIVAFLNVLLLVDMLK